MGFNNWQSKDLFVFQIFSNVIVGIVGINFMPLLHDYTTTVNSLIGHYLNMFVPVTGGISTVCGGIRNRLYFPVLHLF